MERRTFQNIHFIRVKGTNIERAKAHVALLKNEIPQGAVPALAKKNEWVIRRAPGILQSPVLQNLALQFYQRLLVPTLGCALTSEEKEALRAVAQESGIPFKTWRETLLQADALMVLARTSLMQHLLPEWTPTAVPGCTSAVALKEWTQSGRLYACRNFDYFIVGPWEKHQTIVFNEPSESDHVPYVSLTSAGVQVAGVNAINREGLTLATHAHFGKSVSLRGRPIVLLGDEVIRKAKNLNQAIDIIRKNHTCANWSFVMSSAKENTAVVIEMTPKKVQVRGTEDGFIAHSNFFHSPDLHKEEALLCGSFCEDIEGRICQIRKRLEPYRGKVEPSHMSTALGDHRDYFSGQERVVGNTLSVVTTVQSAIFDPEGQKFWLASAQESPVGLSNYIEVDIERFWKQSLEEYSQSMEVLPHYKPQSPGLHEAIRHYREGYRSYHILSDQPDYRENALAHLKKAVTAYPSDGHLWVQTGILCLTMGRISEALSYLEGSLACAMSDHICGVRNLYLARCYDLSQQRAKALPLYSTYSTTREPKLKKALKKGLARPYRASQISSIQVDLQFPDTMIY